MYFGKDESEFVDLLKRHPGYHFKKLLATLKEEGKFDFDPNDEERMQRMKAKLKR